MDFNCDSPNCNGMRANKLWFTMPGLRGTGDGEIQRCTDGRDLISTPGRRSERVTAAAEIRR